MTRIDKAPEEPSADAWSLWISDFQPGTAYLAVRIAEAIEQYADAALAAKEAAEAERDENWQKYVDANEARIDAEAERDEAYARGYHDCQQNGITEGRLVLIDGPELLAAKAEAAALPDDAVDMAAREIAAQVCQHVQHMYPQAAKAVAWQSCKRSLSGVIRNTMTRVGRAAEAGQMQNELNKMRQERIRLSALMKKGC